MTWYNEDDSSPQTTGLIMNVGVRRRLRLPAVAAALAAVVLAATGCASVAHGSTSSNAGPNCNSPGVTSNQINLGMLLSDTGASSGIFASARSGVDARLGVANAAGGIYGRKIVYQWQDDESDMNVNLTEARTYAQSNQVFALFGASGAASGSAAYLHSVGMPEIGDALEPVWSQYANMVSYTNLSPPTDQVVDTPGRFAVAVGASRAVIVQSSVLKASVDGAQTIARILRYAGVNDINIIDIPAGSTDETAAARRIAAYHPDILFAPVVGEDFARVYAATVAAGVHLKAAVGVTGFDQGMVKEFGTQVTGAFEWMNYVPVSVDTPAHRAFLSAMATYAPQLSPPDQEMAVISYVTTDLLLRGLQAAGPCPTRAGFLAALRSIKDFNGGGMLPGPVDLTKGFGQAPLCYTFIRVNAAGSGYDVVNPTICGERIPASFVTALPTGS
jgi:ABC-type branched-subunit amino acid transport system substrate-binding protein